MERSPDWVCSRCATANWAGSDECWRCGVGRTERRVLLAGEWLLTLAVGSVVVAVAVGAIAYAQLTSQPPPIAAAPTRSPSMAPAASPTLVPPAPTIPTSYITPRPTLLSTPGATPLATSPRTTPTPLPPTPAPTSDWTYSAYLTSVAYTNDVNFTYTVLIPDALWDSAAKLFGVYCQYSTGEAIAACEIQYMEEIGHGVLEPAKNHLAWMMENPPASCFSDAYAADRAVAKAYIKAANFLLSWDTAGWDAWIGTADARKRTFLNDFASYFRDCR